MSSNNNNDSVFVDDTGELDFTRPLGNRVYRLTYLLTYAQADLKKFPSCLKFSECVLEAF